MWLTEPMLFDFNTGTARTCVEQCEKTGCVGNKCFQHCNFSSDGNPIDGPWYLQEPLYMRWKQWDCRSDCRYECMLSREEERRKLGNKPTKYHGRWPLRRIYVIQVLRALIALHYGRLINIHFLYILLISLNMFDSSGTSFCGSLCP